MTHASVIIPAFNEEEGLQVTLKRLRAMPFPLEVIVVDDGSTDRTGEVAKQFGARVIRHPANGGYGHSLKSGILAATHDLIAIADADGTYPVEELPAMMQKIEEGFDMVVGARHGAHFRGTFLKMPARFAFQFLVEFSTGRHIPDINSGLRVFRKSDIVPLFPLLCGTFSFTTTLTIAYCFLRKFICYVPIHYEKRIGRSKVRLVRDSLRTLQYIVESIARFNPLKIYLLLACVLLLFALGSAFAWWYFMRIILAVPAAIFLMGAFLIFALGLCAASVSTQHTEPRD